MYQEVDINLNEGVHCFFWLFIEYSDYHDDIHLIYIFFLWNSAISSVFLIASFCTTFTFYSIWTGLFKQEEEILSVSSVSADERKAKLQEFYEELEQHYLNVIRKARLH